MARHPRTPLSQQLLNLGLGALCFSLFLSAFFICLRLGFIAYTGIYKGALAQSVSTLWGAIWQVLGDGVKYDNRIVAIFGLLFLLLGLFTPTRLRSKLLASYACFSIAFCLLLQLANMTFYSIYGDVFNANLLEILDESPKTLLSMAVTGEYFIGTKVLIWLVLSALSFRLYLKATHLATHAYTILQVFPPKFALSAVLFSFTLFMLVSINSRLGLTGVSLDFIVQPAENPFLRKVTPGAFRNLYLVFKDYRKSRQIHFASFSSKPLLQATQEYFHLPPRTSFPLDLRELLKQQSHNPLSPHITHVFYIVSESLSTWHFDPKFDSIGLVSALKGLNDHQHGFIFPLFLENARRTVKSLDVQITGLFNINDTNFVNMGVKIPSLPTAIGNQMKGLGFHNLFYYGGSGIWNRLDSFTKTQGFDGLIFNTRLLEFAHHKLATNPTAYPKPLESNWGVHDNILFDYILEATPSDQNTFTMVMTLSNHTTRNVNLKAFGVPVEEIQAFVDRTPASENLPDANFLGHVYWYDKILVDFIKKARIKFPHSLFVITGDHFDRSFDYAKNNFYMTKSVPLILYAPSLEPKQVRCIGAHIDIAPTIMELVAPKGYTYASFGKPLFSNASIPQECAHDHALGFDVVGARGVDGVDFVYGSGGLEGLNYVQNQLWIKHSPSAQDLKLAENLMEQERIANGLSWYYLFKGPVLREPPVPHK
ncbi:LTA synthase family protein [Helicobacter salomonis]|uniref:LTA synthase family protein n=1 Tax=Helicobacter salomonis TaxID=56878 RepID=UPI000CF06A3E|nr:alkaline phosphatase family protein [Helicobacter salomonis]